MDQNKLSNEHSGIDPRFLLVAGLIIVAAISRILPHPPNFAPVAAMALFGGAMFSRKWVAFAAPLTAMFLSDLMLQVSSGYGFYPGQWMTYLGFVGVTALGLGLRSKVSVGRVAGAAVASSLLFFVVSNLGVFFFGGMYALNFAGLVQCFTMAIPFYQMTLVGDLVYSAALFGGFAFVTRMFPQLGIKGLAPAA